MLQHLNLISRHLDEDASRDIHKKNFLLGFDVLNVYDFVYLNNKGKPQPGILKISLPCESPYLLEHSGLRAYLDLYSEQRWESPQAVQEKIKHDLSSRIWAQHVMMNSASIQIIASHHFDLQTIEELSGLDLDRMDIDYPSEQVSADLTAAFDEQPVSETFCSRLLSLKGIDGRMIWANLQISYTGPQIEQTSLLFFILNLRHQSVLPQQVLDIIFNTIMEQCRPTQLAVHVKFSRQQQIEVNGFRTNYPVAAPSGHRCARQ